MALGACRYGGGMIEQALAHDYCMRSWNRELRDFELVPVVPRGTPYPTEKPVTSKYIKAACDAQQVLGLVIYERSVMERPVISYVNGAEGLRPVREEMRQEARENRSIRMIMNSFMQIPPLWLVNAVYCRIRSR
ncbi:hypothetical protein OO006_06530 [Prosthecochloris sp. SCSIO W1101]|uniref:hypothetical protein n=1 Tax=Prosthecochloris sp. SCSIO W1101 TaxID=2992242 RepID=UPI00223D1082|nr:hypothetical protein [Prosthecochloris sp. SCSIO W1101]UZJ42600.1 hypothetical protein OO006_06530 [Prosthecochloris sp. SCSIO W1101]